MWTASVTQTLAVSAYALGGASLAGEAIVHLQQYFDLFHQVRWIGPLFLCNAVACLAAVAGLALPQTRRPAALTGIVISVVALGSLVISYGHGLFGWQEAGLRTPIVLVLVFEVAAVVFLAAGLAARPAQLRRRSRPATAAPATSISTP